MSDTAKITGDMTVRQVLTAYPHLVAIFEKHGLHGCGGPSGPTEPVAFFASIHRVDAQALIQELNEAAPLAAPIPVAPQGGETLAPYRLFLRTSLLLGVLVGFSLGTIALASRAGVLPGSLYGRVVPFHGYVQLYGWVALFVMGVAYQILPRFVGRPLRSPRLALASYGLVVGGIALQALAVAFPQTWLLVVSGLMVLSGAALFAFLLWDLAFQGPKDSFALYLGVGALWFVVASGLNAAAAFPGLEHLRGASQHLFLVQFAGIFILGVSQRTLSFFLGLRPGSQSAFLVAWLLLNLGVGLRVVGMSLPGAGTLAASGALVEAAALVIFILSLNILRRGIPGQAPPGEKLFGWFLRAAYIWLTVAVALEVVLALRQLTAGVLPDLGQATAARHAFALGFVTIAIFGMASRIVPVFEGHALRRPWLLAACFGAVNLGVALRLAGELGRVPDLLVPSALLGWLGMALFAYSLWPTLRPATAAVAAARPAAVIASMTVAEVVDRYPATLEVFLRRGFTPLKDEALRRTLATRVTVQQVCAMHSADLETLLGELNQAAQQGAVVTGES